MNVWDVIAKGANRFFENIASELEYVQHFATVASRWASRALEGTTMPLYVRTKSTHTQIVRAFFSCYSHGFHGFPRIIRLTKKIRANQCYQWECKKCY